MSDDLQMKYFVLKPAGDDAYAKASRDAMQAYARSIRDENPGLYADLETWRINEQGESNKRDLDRRFASGELPADRGRDD
jgi:hypothetical protein